jgi:hypothetical protein
MWRTRNGALGWLQQELAWLRQWELLFGLRTRLFPRRLSTIPVPPLMSLTFWWPKTLSYLYIGLLRAHLGSVARRYVSVVPSAPSRPRRFQATRRGRIPGLPRRQDAG